MGNSNSRRAQPIIESNSILANHIKNSDNSVYQTDNTISASDRQNIYTIKRDLSETPELFVLNNMLMGIMFFENYTKYTEDLKKDLLKKQDGYIAPDEILEKVSQNVLYRPHHGPQKHHSEPLLPKRFFVLNDWINVVGTTEEIEENSTQTTVRMEESLKKGYVRLRAVNNTFQHNGESPVMRLNSVEPNSRSSEDSSDTNYYTELQNLKTPKPIEILQGLEKHEQSSTYQNGLPKTCISYRKIKKISWDADELIGENLSEDDLYQTVAYINSKSFMKQLENNLFLDGVASELGLDLENINQSESKQEKISCIINDGDKSVPCEIIPSIKTCWPVEQTLKFIMKSNRTPEVRKRFVYPTSSMIKEITTLDCVLLPKGHLKRKGDRKDADIEWEICFPQAQRYLETFMSHAQMKSLIILLTLHKTYVEPRTTCFGLQSEHIRNFMLWECESNFSDWPEHRLGIKLLQVIKNLTNSLSKARPHISDFFINDKNTLSEVSTPKLRQAQKAFDDILQTPLMSFLNALRNLRYTNGKTFFYPFDFKRLYTILKSNNLNILNYQIKSKRAKTVDSEHYFDRFKDGKKREIIMRKRLEEKKKEREANNLSHTGQRKGSVDSIDIDWKCEKKFDLGKKRMILRFFIETFLEISEKSLTITTNKKNTLIYIKQAFYLTRILRDECHAFADEAVEYFEKIEALEKRCNEMVVNQKPVNGVAKTVEFIAHNKEEEIKEVKIKNGFNNENKKAPNTPRKSVMFAEVHQTSQ